MTVLHPLEEHTSTEKKLNERINSYKTGFRNPSKHAHCEVLCNHFTFGLRKGAKYYII